MVWTRIHQCVRSTVVDSHHQMVVVATHCLKRLTNKCARQTACCGNRFAVTELASATGSTLIQRKLSCHLPILCGRSPSLREIPSLSQIMHSTSMVWATMTDGPAGTLRTAADHLSHKFPILLLLLFSLATTSNRTLQHIIVTFRNCTDWQPPSELVRSSTQFYKLDPLRAFTVLAGIATISNRKPWDGLGMALAV